MLEPKISLPAFYNAILGSRGFEAAPHHYPLMAGLEDDRITNLLYLGPPGTGKSNLLCIVYALWALGHDPTLTILSTSAGEALPATFLQACMQIIQHSPVWRELFPDVRPAQDMGWSLQRGLFVAGHHPSDENPSYAAAGIGSKKLTGLHCRLMIMDDLHDRENASNLESRAAVVEADHNTLMGRADPRGIRRVAAGRWWAPDDIYQEWIKSGDWVVLELPAVRPDNDRLWYDVYVPHGLECIYTERLKPAPDHDQDRAANYVKYRAYYPAIDETKAGFYWPGSKSKREEYNTIDRRQPRTAAINYRGDMSGGTDAVFKREDFRIYPVPFGADNFQFGINSLATQRWIAAMRGEVEDAWDTAIGQVQSELLTANLTGLMVPCNSWHHNENETLVGKCDFHYDVYLLDCIAENLKMDELIAKFMERYGLWHPRRSNIEEKQTGFGLLQIAKTLNLPVHPIKVHEGKLERAVNPVYAGEKPLGGGAASVQGWARMGRVLVPDGPEWVDKFLDKICAFTGGTRNTDEFDALVHLVARAIVKSKQRVIMPGVGMESESGPLDHDERMIPIQTLEHIGRQAANPHAHGVQNPFSSFCGAPCHWFSVQHNMEYCALHNRKTQAFGGCEHWAQKGTIPPDRLQRILMEKGMG